MIVLLPGEETRNHYDTLLARTYAWMAGGYEEKVGQYERFFSAHDIRPHCNRQAVDLGAGCGFATLALAAAGFSVTAVDFSQPMLTALTAHAGTLPVQTVHADILATERWTGNAPELIICTGDTLTHLHDHEAVNSLLHTCAQELGHGGRLVISCRNYSRDAAGSTKVIPVRRDADRIFLCRLVFGHDRVMVTDVLYTKETGEWLRHSGSYTKLRIAPEMLHPALVQEGFGILAYESGSDTIEIIAERQ